MTCAICGAAFTAHRDTQRFCSNRCSAKSRSRAFYKAMGKKGGATSGDAKKRAAVARVEDLAAGLTPAQAFLAGARWQTRRLVNGIARRKWAEGYDAGWDACRDHYHLPPSAQKPPRKWASSA